MPKDATVNRVNFIEPRTSLVEPREPRKVGRFPSEIRDTSQDFLAENSRILLGNYSVQAVQVVHAV
jgi:hypothetical protein